MIPVRRRRAGAGMLAMVLWVGFLGSGLASVPAGGESVGPALRHWHPHFAQARRYARSRLGEVSFAMVGPRGGHHAFHGGGAAPMASTYKAMLLAAYLHRARGRQLAAWERDLLRPMIRRSDNDAASRIDEILGRHPIEALAARAHMHHFHWNDTWGLSRTAPWDQARFFARYRDYVPRMHERFAMRQLANIVPSQRWGIAQAQPRGWRLYFKGGWGSGTGLVDHQSALLERRFHAIGLSIMTQRNPDQAYGNETQRGIAHLLLRGLPPG